MAATRLKNFGERTVPRSLLGCWRRNWIRFGDDGELERGVQVIWLQTASGMGDLRIDPTRPASESDSSCGITVVDETETPMVTATWLDGESGFAQQPVSNFPEDGWLSWDSPIIMHELAPSGAYVEEWEKLPGSAGIVAHFIAQDPSRRTNLYVAGSHVFLARERAGHETVHDFSYGTRNSVATNDPADDDVVVELSTIAAHEGESMNLNFKWQLVSCRRT